MARKPPKSLAESRVLDLLTLPRALTARQESRREARHVDQFIIALPCKRFLAVCDERAVLGMENRVLEQWFEISAFAPFLVNLKRAPPAVHRTGDGIRRKRPASRDRREAATFVEVRVDGLAAAPRCLDAERLAPRFADQPEPVAAEPGHMGIDHRQRCRRCHHRGDRRPAGPQLRQAGLAGQMMGRGHHAAGGARRLHHAHVPLARDSLVATSLTRCPQPAHGWDGAPPDRKRIAQGSVPVASTHRCRDVHADI